MPCVTEIPVAILGLMERNKSMTSTGAIRLAVITFCLLASSPAWAQYHGAEHGRDMSAYPKLDYDSLYDAATPLAESAEGRKLVEGCLAAYGGSDHLKALSSFRTKWLICTPLNKVSVHVTRPVGVDRRHRIEVDQPEREEVRILHGREAWTYVGDAAVSLDGMRYKAELFSNLVLNLPLSLKSEPYSDRRIGHRDGDSLAYLYLDKADSLLLVVGIDPRSHLIMRAEGIIKHEKNRMVFVNLFSDHRKVDGYLMPHALTNISMGMNVGESVMEDAQINGAFSDPVFEPPESLPRSKLN